MKCNAIREISPAPPRIPLRFIQATCQDRRGFVPTQQGSEVDRMKCNAIREIKCEWRC